MHKLIVRSNANDFVCMQMKKTFEELQGLKREP